MYTGTIDSIKEKTHSLIKRYEKTTLSDEEEINLFLDNINKIKKPIKKTTAVIEELDQVLLLITWVNVKTENDEYIVKETLNICRRIHKEALKKYVKLNKILSKQTFKNTLRNFKDAVDDFEDSILEVNEVIFGLRKDKDIMQLSENI